MLITNLKERELFIVFSKQIEVLRRRNGWSQAELAHRLHISSSAVGMYEQGRREPSLGTLVALSKEFGVTIDYLVTGSLCAITDPRINKQSQQILDVFSEIRNLSREDLILLLISSQLK
jgi:transcriptional regulator with XRE-family HTH domain